METVTQVGKMAQAATQTDGPHIGIKETDLKAIDKNVDFIIKTLAKDKTYVQIAAAKPLAVAKQLPVVKPGFEKARKV